jgi:hypothetical protein
MVSPTGGKTNRAIPSAMRRAKIDEAIRVRTIFLFILLG